MIKVYQTKLHDPENGVQGNCYRGCLASIFECEVEDIPAIEEQSGDPEKWDWTAIDQWLKVKGKAALGVSIDWYKKHHKGVGEKTLIYPNGYYIGSGVGPTGVRHSVVYLRGEPVHDPHPGWDGEIKLDEIQMFLNIKEADDSDCNHQYWNNGDGVCIKCGETE